MRYVLLACAVAITAEYVVFLSQNRHRINVSQTMLFLSFVISSFGQTIVGFSDNIQLMLLGNGLCYATVFAVTFMTFVVQELCKVKIPVWYKVLLLLGSGCVFFLTQTYHFSDLYYRHFEVGYAYGCYYPIKEYGPLHKLFYLQILICTVTSVCVISYAARKQRSFSFKNSVICIISILAVVLGYAIPRAIHTTLNYDCFVYLMAQSILFYIFSSLERYDLTANLMNVLEQRQEYGYICFDSKLRFIGANGLALKIFPELRTSKVDFFVDENESKQLHELINWFKEFKGKESEELVVKTDTCAACCTIRYMSKGRRFIGYMIEMVDDTANQNYIRVINEYNSSLETAVAEKTAKLQEIQGSIVTGLASLVESRDNSTGGHIKRTSSCVKVFVDHLKNVPPYKNLNKEYFDYVVKAAPMHDLGKIAVDDAILRKPGKFTPEEYEFMKHHSAEGAKIVSQILKDTDNEFFKTIAVNVAHYHHEKWDGSGYPTGINGEQIPLEARIMALADVFDALVSKRVYKEPFSFDEAISIIEQSLGSHFDPELGREFVSCKEQLVALYQSLES